MTHRPNYSNPHPAVELLLENGFESTASILTLLFNEAMQIERSQALKAIPYERTEDRTGYANGFKPKTVKTRVGSLELSIPQVRGNIDFYPRSLEKGIRSERALNLAIAEMYIQGVSTRKVMPIMEQLCGEGISSSKVSQVTKELDEELKKWRNLKIGCIPYLIFDARYEKVRVDGIVRSCAVLVAIGVKEDGKRTILGVDVSLSEGEVHWREFFRNLKQRGLYGTKMITSDDHPGLQSALKTEFNGIPWQRCQFHLQQNASQYVPQKDMKKKVASDIRAIFNAPDKEEAERLLKMKVEKYENTAKQLSEWMEKNIIEGLTVFTLPESHRTRTRTTNLAERINKELKRRSRVIEIFPNTNSLLRIMSALLKEKSEEWEVETPLYINFTEGV